MNHIIDHKFQYETEKLIRVFFPFERIDTTTEPNGDERFIATTVKTTGGKAELTVDMKLSDEERSLSETVFNDTQSEYEWQTLRERKLAALLFELLCTETSYRPPWGILTGIRPSKLMNSFIEKSGRERAAEIFEEDYLVSKEKALLALNVAENERQIIEKSKEDSYSLYISIPFCPSRCSYCSFVSHSNERAKELIPAYLEKLLSELSVTADIAEELGLKLESIYIGGGTPTVLDEEQLTSLTSEVDRLFLKGKRLEYTIEAGRPDSITPGKLEVIRRSGANRISINPQTLNDVVLRNIGRNHSTSDFFAAMKTAKQISFHSVNTDLIAGLPGDTVESFEATLDSIIDLSPENITVHTLSLKKSSSMAESCLRFDNAKTVVRMLEVASEKLYAAGYLPYYMYRQSKCIGNLENVGWAKKGFECEYNVQMMEETHTVLAVGAGAVTRLKNSSRIDRIFNFKYPFEYIDDFDEIIKRKQKIRDFYS